MKLYQTKNVLFYSESTIVSRLIQLFNSHKKTYGQVPKRIYMSKAQWSAYEEYLSKNTPYLGYEFETTGYPRITKSSKYPSRTIKVKEGIICMTFRGVPIVMKEDWKRLCRA